MADVNVNLKEFNVEFDDTNTSKSANIVSGHDIKESFATIHKRLNNMGYTFGTEAISITSSTDLNNYLTPGIYSCHNTSLTITNAPISDTFKLYVIHIVNSDTSPGDYYAQYFIPCAGNCIYVRYCATFMVPAFWSDWERLGEQVILSYGNSTWDDFYNAYKHNAVVYCRASSNSNPATGSQTRLAFMAYVNNGTDPTEVEFQYYRSVSSHSDSQQGDQVFIYKLVKNSGWSVTTREASSKIAVTSPIAKSYSNGTITLSHATSGVTAGTYDSVTVDAKGHVTAGSNARVSNVAYNTTNDPILTETIDGTTTTIETPDTVPILDSKHLITSNAVAEPVAFLANTGHKNLLKNLHESTSLASNSVRVNLNEDGTYSLSGTASVGVSLVGTGLFSDIPASYVGKKLRLTGGVNSSVQIRIYTDLSSSISRYQDSGSGVDFVLTQEMLTTPYDIRLFIAKETVCDGITVKPMLRLASIPDDTFEPYAKTNAELTAENASQQAEINYAVNAGVKNYCPYNNLTANSAQTIIDKQPINLPAGTYLLTCSVTASTGSTGIRLLKDGTSLWNRTISNTGGLITEELTITDNANQITIYTGVENTLSNIMIRPAAITDPTFQPYAPTNRELYETKVAQEDLENIINCLETKNLCPYDSLSITSGNHVEKEISLSAGKYIISYNTTATTGYTTWGFRSNGTAKGGAYLYNNEQQKISGNVSISANVDAVRIYCNNVNSNTLSNIMIRPVGTDDTFTPYSKTNLKLTKDTTELFDDVDDIKSTTFALGSCTSAADAQKKVVTISDANWTKTVGGIIAVQYTNTNTFSADADNKITLEVNGTENEVYYNATVSPTGVNTLIYGVADRYIYYFWNGTYWVWLGHGADNNTTYSSMTEAEINAGTGTTARLITPARLNKAIRGICNSLTSGTDLNTLKTSGSYYCSSVAIAQSCTHRPAYTDATHKNFRLEVIYISSTTSLMQKLYTIVTSGTTKGQIEMFYRGFYSDTWGSWRQVTDSTVSDYTT